MLEISIEGAVVKRAEAAGWFVRKVGWIGRRGAPDRVFAKNGRTVWIEFKQKDKTARLLQDEEHREMRAAGMETHVCDSIEQGLRILKLL
jgi:hypothetical protein